MKQKEIDKLWEDYQKNKSMDTKEKLIIEYAPLIKYVAGRLNMYLGQNVEYEDLMGYGAFGLIDAIDKYDMNKGVKFETYASLRIRGSILDSIRKNDWVPRSLRQKQKQLEKAYMELETELGRPAEDKEVATKLNMNMKQFQDFLKKVDVLSITSLEEYMDHNNEFSLDIHQQKQSDQPERQLEKKELQEILNEAIEKLPEKEKKVVFLYYFEELTLKEISAIIGVSESRISQLHTKAVMRLRGKLGKHKSILFGV